MISMETFKQAAKLLEGNVIRTPLVYSPTLSHMFGAEIYLKLENLQKTGSFKIRGATYKMRMRFEEIGAGVLWRHPLEITPRELPLPPGKQEFLQRS